MAIQPKLIATMGAVTLLTFAANFAAFILCCNYLATPYLEAQQQEVNAEFILSFIEKPMVSMSRAQPARHFGSPICPFKKLPIR